MFPKIELFGLTVSTYSLTALLAAVAFAAIAWRPLRRCALPAAGVAGLLVSICAAFLAGARLWNVAVAPGSYGAEMPWYAFRMTGFGVLGGIAGAIAAVLLAALIARTSPLGLLDAVTVPGAAAFCIARAGCFLSGCCHGVETSLPWGVVFPPETKDAASAVTRAVHPTQLYELFLALIGIPLCLFIVKRARAKTGGLFFIYGAWFCTMRLVVHPLREFPYSPIVSEIVYPALYYVLTVAGVFLFVWSCRAKRSKTDG